MPNSINFYKGIFLHAIPVRIIVPYCEEAYASVLFVQGKKANSSKYLQEKKDTSNESNLCPQIRVQYPCSILNWISRHELIFVKNRLKAKTFLTQEITTIWSLFSALFLTQSLVWSIGI